MDPLDNQYDLPSTINLKRVSQQRIVIAVAGICALCLILIGRLVYLQVVSYDEYHSLSTANRVQVMPIAPVRGEIFDRNGVLLAKNETTFTLGVVPDKAQDMQALMSKLQQHVPISDQEIGNFENALKYNHRSSVNVLKEYLTEDQVGRLSVNYHHLPGTTIDPKLYRVYSSGEQTAHVVGRVSRIDRQDLEKIDVSRYRAIRYIGKFGVEQSKEELLVGWPGYQHVEINAHGQKIRTLSTQTPVSGQDIYLTIDSNLHKVAFDAMGDHKGAVVAMEPKTGKILAMVSKPSFDPNVFGLTGRSENKNLLLEDPTSPLLNRALHGKYSPGSTIKPFVGLAFYENALGNETYHCNGQFTLPGVKKPFRCWKKTGHGQVDLRKAIAESCDVFFYAASLRLGIDRMYEELSKFGFGQPTGVDLAHEPKGILPSKRWKREALNEPWYLGETLISGIGQGAMSVTMLQLAYATSTLANRGEKFAPYIVGHSVDVNSGEIHKYLPKNLGKVDVDGKFIDRVISMMTDVVHGQMGTARRISEGLQYNIASKTGTVQVIGRAADEEWKADEVAKKFHPHGIFIAFAPVENPQIAVAAVIENIGSGSSVAPMVRKIMDYHILGDDASPADDRIASVLSQ